MAGDSDNEKNIFESCIKLEKVFPDLCRVCMCKNENMKSVFSTDLTRTVEELEYCTGILMTKEDGLPTLLCDSCSINLSVAYKFKTACLFADKVFKKILGQKLINNTIKKEEEEVLDESEYPYQVPIYTKQELDLENDADDFFQIQDKELKTQPPPKPKEKKKKVRLTKEERYKKGLMCDICGMKFQKKEQISQHMWNAHGFEWIQNISQANNLTVKRVVKSKQKISMKGAIDKDEEIKEDRSLCCDVCELKLSTKELLLKHKLDVHGCDWICEICGKQYIHRSSVYSHIRSHLPPEHGCPHCDYKTWHKADLKKHLRIHTGDKIYVCEYCTSSFHTTSNLHGHIRRHHSVVAKAYTCPRCDHAFHTGDKLRRHLDSHDNIKRHECDVCHAQFTRRCHWKKHLQKQHSIVVPFLRPGRQKKNFVTGDYDPIKQRLITTRTKLIVQSDSK